MPFNNYKLWGSLGDLVGIGDGEARNMGVAAVAKPASGSSPNLVLNEIVCNDLARALLLPVPPGFAIKDDDEQFHYASLNFLLASEDLPPINPKNFVQQNEALSYGIFLFDVWVMNTDRHNENLAHFEATGAVQIFDHERALLGYVKEENIGNHLAQSQKKLCVSGHCLAQHLREFSKFSDWLDKIEKIPDYYIKETIESGVPDYISDSTARKLIDFMIERRDTLKGLLRKNITKTCPNITFQQKEGTEAKANT